MKNRPILNVFILSIFLCFEGCISNREAEITNEIVITPYRIVDQVNDSIFFGFIADIVADDSVILFLDHSNKRLIACDHQFNLIQVIGRSGKGPGELQYPSEVSIKNGFYLIRDNLEIKKYSRDGTFTGSIETKTNLAATFSLDNQQNYYLYAGAYGSLPIIVIDKSNNLINSFGVKYQVQGNDRQQVWFQSRNLFVTNDNQLLSVGTSYPSVELYDLKGELLHYQQLDEPIIAERYKKIVENLVKEPNGIGFLYNDTYLFKKQLYILKTTRVNEKMFSYLYVWKISHDKITPAHRYELRMNDEREPSFDKVCLLNDSILVVSEMNTMSLCFFKL